MSSGPVGKMPLIFLASVMVASAPFYFLERRSLLPDGMPFIPVSALMVFASIGLAVVFTLRESGWSGVGALLWRAVDVRKIKPILWFIPTFTLLPAALCAAYFVSRMQGGDLAAPPSLGQAPIDTLLQLGVLLFFLAVAEEVGWMGYAAEPLQRRWGALGAALAIGAAWAVWHWPPWWREHVSVEWVAWQSVVTVLLRILIFWLYNNTSGSVLAAGIFHASFNAGYGLFFEDGATYEPGALAAVLGVVVFIVVLLRGPATLAGGRSPRSGSAT